MSGEPRLSELAERLVCRLFGHRWCLVGPREGHALDAIFRPFKMCSRCGQVDR